jgi:hypothetical protein
MLVLIMQEQGLKFKNILISMKLGINILMSVVENVKGNM